MKKGFMFSIEAIMSVALVLSVMGLIAYSSYYIEPQDNSLRLMTQADSAGMLYFNGPTVSLDYNNTVCEKIVYYNITSKTIGDKNACRGYK